MNFFTKSLMVLWILVKGRGHGLHFVLYTDFLKSRKYFQECKWRQWLDGEKERNQDKIEELERNDCLERRPVQTPACNHGLSHIVFCVLVRWWWWGGTLCYLSYLITGISQWRLCDLAIKSVSRLRKTIICLSDISRDHRQNVSNENVTVSNVYPLTHSTIHALTC